MCGTIHYDREFVALFVREAIMTTQEDRNTSRSCYTAARYNHTHTRQVRVQFNIVWQQLYTGSSGESEAERAGW